MKGQTGTLNIAAECTLVLFGMMCVCLYSLPPVFVAACVDHILSLYTHVKHPRLSVAIIAHSMVGSWSLALFPPLSLPLPFLPFPPLPSPPLPYPTLPPLSSSLLPLLHTGRDGSPGTLHSARFQPLSCAHNHHPRLPPQETRYIVEE